LLAAPRVGLTGTAECAGAFLLLKAYHTAHLGCQSSYGPLRRAAAVGLAAVILDGPAHLVEIDLLRGGRSMPAEDRPDCAYSVLVSRAERRLDADFWPISLRDRLSTIPVPVRGPDPDAHLDLQAMRDQIHAAAGYGDYIYEGEPDPPLDGEDAAWARGLAGRASAS
jgi:hypothetical protein